MPPQMSTYQQAAQSIYEPQKAAEQIQLQSTRDITKNALESQKGQVNTDYTAAVQKLTQAVEDQTGQINQLYSQRLGGNFSGLQGNDMGKMFSRTNQAQGIIEQTRLNKIGEITTGQTNADIAYGAGVAALTPKYQSLESEYANNAYGAAVKDYRDEQQRQFDNYIKSQNLSLSYARLAQSGSKGPSDAQLKMNDMGTIAKQLQSKAGKDGHVSQQTWNAAMAQWLAAGYNAKDFVNSNMQFINQRYSGYHGFR